MELKSWQSQKSFFRDIWRESWRGKSLDRIMFNNSLRQIKIGGQILDLGAGSGSGSYHRFVQYQQPYQITYTDFFKNKDQINMVQVDLEKPFPLEDNQYDNITCFNVLEHIYNYNNLLSESLRILKSGGLFIGSVPFLVGYHPDPNDFWRYTHQTLEKIMIANGFTVDSILVYSLGPLAAGWIQFEFIIPKILKPLFIFPIIFLDNLIIKYKKSLRNKFVMGYLFIGHK